MWWYSPAHYPSLYSHVTPVLCPICQLHNDTNTSLGLCPPLLQELNAIFMNSQLHLASLLRLHASERAIMSNLEQDINNCPLFFPIHNASHLGYLIIHQFVPQILVDLIYKYTLRLVPTKKILMDFLQQLQTNLYCRSTQTMGIIPSYHHEKEKDFSQVSSYAGFAYSITSCWSDVSYAFLSSTCDSSPSSITWCSDTTLRCVKPLQWWNTSGSLSYTTEFFSFRTTMDYLYYFQLPARRKMAVFYFWLYFTK